LKPGAIKKWVMEDWKLLIDRMKIREDRAYLCHEGKPMVAVWGMGFSDGRKYSLEECEQLVRFLKEDPEYGGNTVMLGLPTHWRTLTRDAVADRKLHAIVRLADIVSPWMVGRYKNLGQVRTHAKTTVAADIEWCSKNGMAYLPVAFPGFSWQNLKKSRGSAAELGEIPRRGISPSSAALPRLFFKFCQLNPGKATGRYAIPFLEHHSMSAATVVFACVLT
jgi:hypothetical protein